MKRIRFTARRIILPALVTLPIAGVVLLGSVAWASADTGSKGTDRPTYHSSVLVGAKESAEGPAADLALTKAAKITMAQAIAAGSAAVPGGTATGIELTNEGGNVVYTAHIVTSTGENDVVIDAGNGNVLAKVADQRDSD